MVRRPGELFARFTPEPPEALEEGAARATLYTVFHLYCVEGLTVEQVVRECRCARSLVFLRLCALRRKLGTDPRRLRQYSGHFERIEESPAEPRARWVDRTEVVETDAD